MLPILISVSVTPVSYFFCARAGAAESASTVAESASLAANWVKRLRTNGVARRCMGFSPWARREI